MISFCIRTWGMIFAIIFCIVVLVTSLPKTRTYSKQKSKYGSVYFVSFKADQYSNSQRGSAMSESIFASVHFRFSLTSQDPERICSARVCHTTKDDTMRCYMMRCDAMLYDVIRCYTMRYEYIRCIAMLYDVSVTMNDAI